MKKKRRGKIFVGLSFLAMFLLWTVLVRFVDVGAIGPQGSSVGFSSLNKWFHNLTGVNIMLYYLTDLFSIVPLFFVGGFALLGAVQFISRKNILNVDYSIRVLGVFYAVVAAVYLLFEVVVINYRPVLIDGVAEASYPSSTTMLVLCVMLTAVMQLNSRIKNKLISKIVSSSITVFTLLMIAGRMVSGVHWVSDIVGGVFLSLGLVYVYSYFVSTPVKVDT